MISGMFKKEPTNTIFLHELLKKELDTEWLNEALKKIDINYLDKDNNSFLMKCLKVHKKKAAVWLIESGIDLTVVNHDGESTFNLALKYGNKEIVSMILEKEPSIDINKKDSDNRTILQNMVVQGKKEIAKVLIEKGIDINNTDNHGRNVIYDALSYGDESFIAYISKVDGLNLDIVDENGNNILLHSEVAKNDDIAKELLIAGANPITKNKQDESFLIRTALRGEEADDLIDVMLENCTEDHTPSMIMQDLIETSANMMDDQEEQKERLLATAKKSMKAGAMMDSNSEGNSTALIDAVKLNDLDITALLLSSDANIDTQNDAGNTALMEAVFDGMKNIKIVKLLMQHNPDTTLKNKKNQTVYELLNLMEVHNFGTEPIRDYELLFRVEKHGNYYEVLNVILKATQDNLDAIVDSRGNPLFFMPLLNNHFNLYKLYIKHGLNVHSVNKAKHNIFFEYVTRVFKRNIQDKEFRNNLSSLLSSKVDKNAQDSLGRTILHNIISTKCNEELFKILTNIVSFDYTIVDNQGRTALHSAVWGKKNNIAKLLTGLDKDTMKIADNYGLLPLDYAALLGSQEMLLFFLRNGSVVRSKDRITDQAIKKFLPMLKNLKDLKVGLDNPDVIRNVNIVIRQIIKDFKII
jgi:ankyrin repeat protein